MASKVDVFALKLRLCALEIEALEALSPLVRAAAFPRWFPKCETFPYFIHRIGRFSADESADDEGEEMSIYVYTVISRLVVAHVTAEYIGEVNEALDDYVPQVVEYVDAHELLQSASYLTSLPYLTRFSFTDGDSFMVFPPSPGGVQQVGAEFQWRAEFDKTLVQTFQG